jgi:hypothetical protein
LFRCPPSDGDVKPRRAIPPSDGVRPGVLSALLSTPPNAAGDVTCKPRGRPMYRAAADGAGDGKSPGESTSFGSSNGSLADGVPTPVP